MQRARAGCVILFPLKLPVWVPALMEWLLSHQNRPQCACPHREVLATVLRAVGPAIVWDMFWFLIRGVYEGHVVSGVPTRWVAGKIHVSHTKSMAWVLFSGSTMRDWKTFRRIFSVLNELWNFPDEFHVFFNFGVTRRQMFDQVKLVLVLFDGHRAHYNHDLPTHHTRFEQSL